MFPSRRAIPSWPSDLPTAAFSFAATIQSNELNPNLHFLRVAIEIQACDLRFDLEILESIQRIIPT